jgi:DNA-directed RNA polymerase specialized sigma24 family protein
MVRPLKKIDHTGACYRRPPEIEAAIDVAVAQDLEHLRARAVGSSAHGDALQPEVLVYLVREARRLEDQRTLSALVPLLLARCEAVLRRRVPDGALFNAEEVREEILRRFAILLAEDGSREGTHVLDFYECRFHRAFRTLRIEIVRAARRTAEHVQDLPSTIGDVVEVKDQEDGVLARLSEAYRSQPTQVDDLQRSELANAINSLPADQRKAVILVYLYGMKEESGDPAEPSAARECNVTGRAIRYRLTQALATLAKILKENR